MVKTRRLAAVVTIVLVTTIGLATLYAQEQHRTRPRSPQAREAEAKAVTLAGTLVDLQCYMSGKFVGKSPEACSRSCIRRGVPAALDTRDGLVVLGVAKGTSAKLALHAMNTVEVTGTLYEKRGLKYLEVGSIKRLKGLRTEPADEYEVEPEDEPTDVPEEPEEPDEPNTP